ncbi:MAG: hypothetical protein ACJAW0_000984 [Zhongshania sp.]
MFTGAMVANLMGNLKTFTIIFCGYFNGDAEPFPKPGLEKDQLH